MVITVLLATLFLLVTLYSISRYLQLDALIKNLLYGIVIILYAAIVVFTLGIRIP